MGKKLKKLREEIKAKEKIFPESSYYTAYILILNFKSELEELSFDNFVISKVTDRNYDEYKEIFTANVYRNANQYVIKRIFTSPLPLPEDISSDSVDLTGVIPYTQEDLMFLLRLYKGGDIVFIEQIIVTPAGTCLAQFKYPMVFSYYHSTFYYEISGTEIPALNTFINETPYLPGWNSKWLKIAKRYFLWGGSKEFYPERDNERILDYMIALESVLVSEGDFISRRLKERAANLFTGTDEQKNIIRELIKKFYGYRSILAHGNELSSVDISYIIISRVLFENTVRDILKMVIKNCPLDTQAREAFLKDRYDITDQDRVRKIISDIKAIKDEGARKFLLEQITS